MTKDSFTFNDVDMFEQFHLKVIAYDFLLPGRRQRRLSIPLKSGSYDYDSANPAHITHDDRILRMECMVHGPLTTAQFDQLKLTLSEKGTIIMWDKPDRYYYGDLYDPTEVIDSFQHVFREFELSFLCAPYAYGLNVVELSTTENRIPIEYAGTHKTPARIVIRNNGTQPMQGVMITSRMRVKR